MKQMEQTMIHRIINGLDEAAVSAREVLKLKKQDLSSKTDAELSEYCQAVYKMIPKWIPYWVADYQINDIVMLAFPELFTEISRREREKYVAEMVAEHGDDWERIIAERDEARHDAMMTEAHGDDWREKQAKCESFGDILRFNLAPVSTYMNKDIWHYKESDDSSK